MIPKFSPVPTEQANKTDGRYYHTLEEQDGTMPAELAARLILENTIPADCSIMYR
jgi:hypothetical protein